VAGKLQQGGLTRRQLEILQLVAQGRTNQEIAAALSVSPRTVEMHVGDILARLDCHTRTEAVRKAGELSLLKIP
jgi:DNA-binding NarL/FixJ family response regulator